LTFDREAVATALREHGSIAATARALGVERRRLSEYINGDAELQRLHEGLRAALSVVHKRPDPDRLAPVLVVPDLHAPYHDEHAWQLMLDVARDLKPEVIVCIGDLADFYAISAHSKDPTRATKLQDEVRVVREKRAELDALGAVRKIFCEGNHCYRLGRYLRDKAPELFGIIDVPGVLGLDEAGWEFIEYRNHKRRGSVHYTHDTGASGRYATFKSLDTYQHSVVTGHTHRLVYVVEGNAVGDAKLSASFGWLGDVNQIDYMHRAKAKKDWALAFGVGYEDTQTGHTFLVPIPIVDYRCVFNGKLYKAPGKRKRR
jgi:predicted phosphodiesterase